MKHKITTIFVAGLLLLFSSAVFAANPDLSGVWTLDAAKSEGLPPGMKQMMTVTQTGDKISLETKVITDQGEQTVPDSYTLDGKEADFAPKLQDGTIAKGRRTAKWTADGLEVKETINAEMPEGTATIETSRKWMISADGKTLKIDIRQTLPNGETKQVKRIFTKN